MQFSLHFFDGGWVVAQISYSAMIAIALNKYYLILIDYEDYDGWCVVVI